MNKNRDRGFSYIEMIIALAIMAIMIGLVTISIGTNNRNNVVRTSEKLESLVNQARISALTKGTSNGYLNLTVVGNGIYAYVGEQIAEDNPEAVKSKGEKICSSNLTIQLNGTVQEGVVNSIGFLQSTGGLGYGSKTVMVMHGSNLISSTFQIYQQTGKTYR